MRRTVFIISILFFAKISFANDTIIVHKDARLDLLTQKQIQMNKLASMLTSSGLYKGFRVQIISTSNRDEAFKMKADVLTKFPDQKSYIIFQAPNYKIRIGNFLKREDAENYRKQITNSFPQEIYVVEDAIEYTPKGNEEISQ
ncbi:MAG: SPOR domain-containing protein [Bacteroidota bacterium]|nr:SPOR domain-containing protein [Bacteroidota bacterium]